MNTRTQQITQEFYSLHPDLSFLQEELLKTFQLLSDTFRAGGKLLICGNGGSSADSEHIVGELMKGFLLKRPLSIGKKAAFSELFGAEGAAIADALQGALPTISLSTHTALNTAFANDVEPSPVSYTHLDVYKRQGIDRPNRPPFWPRPLQTADKR